MDGPLNIYRRMEIVGTSQLDLILKVYNGAIAAYKTAAKCYTENDLKGGYKELERAKRFVVHLYTTLNLEEGGDIAEKLGKLYTFVICQTNVVEATKDLSQIDDIVSILDNLRLGWQELKLQEAEKKHESEPQEAVISSGGGFTTSA